MNDQTSSQLRSHVENIHINGDQQSQRSTINSCFPIRHGLNLLPVFNGKNIPVHQFTFDCKRVLKLIESEERLFFFKAILQTKLTGDIALIRSG